MLLETGSAEGPAASWWLGEDVGKEVPFEGQFGDGQETARGPGGEGDGTSGPAEACAQAQTAGTAGLRATAGCSVEWVGSGVVGPPRELSSEGPEGHRTFPRERDTDQALSGVTAYVGKNGAQGK